MPALTIYTLPAVLSFRRRGIESRFGLNFFRAFLASRQERHWGLGQSPIRFARYTLIILGRLKDSRCPPEREHIICLFLPSTGKPTYMDHEEAIIDVQNASIFQADHLVLTNVCLQVGKGEFVYLIGKVGSGKSSLIKTFTAEIPLKTGTARVGKYMLHELKRRQVPHLRRSLGIVFQDFQLLNDRSVEKNLEFVLKATGWKNDTTIQTRISEVLERVGLERKGFKMPHQLSGGEQQRVVIARALLNNPDIILADEPTGNLDPETSADIMKILLEISTSGRAVVMATHNYTLLKKFPARTLRCENSQVSEVQENSEIDFSSLIE
jgi:cell division transport system ATP-binding protein